MPTGKTIGRSVYQSIVVASSTPSMMKRSREPVICGVGTSRCTVWPRSNAHSASGRSTVATSTPSASMRRRVGTECT